MNLICQEPARSDVRRFLIPEKWSEKLRAAGVGCKTTFKTKDKNSPPALSLLLLPAAYPQRLDRLDRPVEQAKLGVVPEHLVKILA